MVAVLIISAASLSAQTEKKEKILVAGACGMCEARIEKTAKAIEGVVSADWDKETHMLDVTLSGDKTDTKAIQKAMAMVGHDTKLFKAEDAVYEKLPACCHYERLPVEKKK